MQVKCIENQGQWDRWLQEKNIHTPFTQSWAWGDILIAEGKTVERLAVVENDTVIAQAQIGYTSLPFGWRYAFCPKGPVVKVSGIQYQVSNIYDALADYLKSNNCLFLRCEPLDQLLPTPYSLCLKKTIDINPPATLLLDLEKPEAKLLAAVHPKTRYNIRLAEKKNITIQSKKNLAVLLSLLEKTGKRDEFRLHAKEHYQHVLFSPLSHQLIAYYDTMPVATCVFVAYGDTFTYLYGASDYEHRSLMAPHVLQWEGIRLGKGLGCRWYDFFGVAPRVDEKNGEYMYDPTHQYAGVTRFKLGFGGMSYQTAGTWDLVIDRKRYYIYQMLRKLRRLF